MPRKRSSKRRRSPVAAIVAIIVLGSTALALDSVGGAAKESQLAATEAAQTSSTQTGQTAQGATQQDACVNGNSLKVTVSRDSQTPKIVTTKKNTALNANHPTVKDTCMVQFCVLQTASGQNTQQSETCTDPRLFTATELKNVSASSEAATMQALSSGLIDKALASGEADKQTALDSLFAGLPSPDSDAIQDAWQDATFEEYESTIAKQADAQQVLNDLSEEMVTECKSGSAYCDQLDAEWKKTAAELEAVQARRWALEKETQSLGDEQGTVQKAPSYNCPGSPGCVNPQTEALRPALDCPPGKNCSGSTLNQPSPKVQQQPSAGCSGLSCLFGGGQQQPQQQCGYVNGRYVCVQAQQCNGIQQFLSGCPNPFMPGQQQCGGLMAMLNKCPAGSYNPNNPSNPYNYPPPTCSIQASPQNAAAGQAVTLQWQSQYAQYANVSGLGQVGPSGSTTVYPQGPMTYTMNVVGYGNQQGQCQAQFGGQNAGTGTGTGTNAAPVAQISCQPLTADIGTQIAISYACQNAATSVGSGFSTGGALSGSAVATVGAPTLGQNTVNYGLTCSNQGKTHSAQCTINVNKAAIVLVANPKNVESGEAANIGWVTSGMDSCVISSSNAAFTDANADATNVSGAAKTPALTQDESFTLTCTTKAGGTKVASTTVQVID